MKRSQTVTLVLLGAAGLAAYGLSGTGSAQTEAEIFRNAEECIASGNDAEECRRARQAALEANDANAPRFAARSDCEADFGAGNCQQAAAPAAPVTPAPGSTAANQTAAPAQQQAGMGSYFIPAMLGYAMARGLSGPQGARAAQPLYGCAPGGGPGCFKTARGVPVAATRSPLGARAAPIARMPAAGFQRSAAASPTIIPRGSSLNQTVSRGGFGTTGRSMSSFGAGG